LEEIMGLQIILSIHQNDDVVFDDIAALNKDLMDADWGELYEEIQKHKDFEGPVKQETDGTVRLASRWDSDFSGYKDYGTMVWGCYSDKIWNTFAKHMKNGKLVFFLEVEGNPNEFYIITPGKVEHKSEEDIRF
jgi:hypothetical protein